MKRFSIILLISLLVLVSCGKTDDEPIELDDLLKIYVNALDSDLRGSFTYDRMNHSLYGGVFVTEDGRELSGTEVFSDARLELGKPRTMAPMGSNYTEHAYIYIEYDGTVEVELLEDEGSKFAMLGHSKNQPDAPRLGNKTLGKQITARGPFVLNFCPIGIYFPGSVGGLVISETLYGVEYYVQIRALDGEGRMVVTAKLRLEAIKDELYGGDDWIDIYGEGEERTRFLEIELVEYEYNDRYKLDNMEE